MSTQPPPEPDGAPPSPDAYPPPPPSPDAYPPPPPWGAYPPPGGYGQPGGQLPHQSYLQPVRRPVWRIVLGTFLLVLAGLLTLSVLLQLAYERAGAFANPAEALGYFLAAGVSIGVPLVIGLILLLKKPKSPFP